MKILTLCPYYPFHHPCSLCHRTANQINSFFVLKIKEKDIESNRQGHLTDNVAMQELVQGRLLDCTGSGRGESSSRVNNPVLSSVMKGLMKGLFKFLPGTVFQSMGEIQQDHVVCQCHCNKGLMLGWKICHWVVSWVSLKVLYWHCVYNRNQ